MNPFSLEGKNILITGASSGIGRQCAISCSQMGATVILVARREDKLLETIKDISSDKYLYYSFDVTNYCEIEDLVKKTVTKVGRINGLIHCAGIEATIPLTVTKASHYQELFATNVISGFEFAKVLSKKIYFSSEGCSFVFISSVRGILGEVAHTAYCSSKGAIISGVKAMALELAEKKIRVNCISPAQIEGTEMTSRMLDNFTEKNKIDKLSMHPLGYGNTSDVAFGCIYLLSDASKWITGTNLIIDGGYSAK